MLSEGDEKMLHVKNFLLLKGFICLFFPLIHNLKSLIYNELSVQTKGKKMKEAVIQATENFCSTILCEAPQKAMQLGNYFYGSAIALIENECEHLWYLFFEKEVLDAIALNLLFEENLCEDDLDDLLKEIANQIIGSAKVLLEEKYPHNDYHLSVPEFMGNVATPFPISLREAQHFQIAQGTFVIAN
jgi:hypothetical protein